MATACTTTKQVLADLVCAYARRNPPRSITIVGNAPLPPSPRRAALVDDSDLVVRMTTFALDRRGGAAIIGRRTDVVLLHRAVVPGPGTFQDHASRLYLLVEPGRLHWEREDRPDWWPVHPVSVPNHPFAVALKELMGIPADEAAWPTTGTLAVYVFSELFPEAELRFTGTTVAERGDQTEFTHGWGPAVAVTPEHRLAAEGALLRGWAAQGRIELVA
ncbi:MAG: hypothetical protein JOY78_11195 [Pseudonocardia sp.]|nr:hypothetical protein [Pseudonocardia sp.]